MDGHFYIIFTRFIMGNNGWLLLRIIMLFLHCYCIIIAHYYIVIMSWFLRIINHYCILLHIIAYCCFFQTHVTVILSWQDQGPAHQKLMEPPDDDVSEPYICNSIPYNITHNTVQLWQFVAIPHNRYTYCMIL